MTSPVDTIVDDEIRLRRIAVSAIAPDMREETRQPRLLPLPEEMSLDGEYRDVARELIALGQSLRERQIQPITVFRGTSTHYPQAEYLILVGHRRWTAAKLVGLEELDAVVVEPPNPVERVLLQYVENESREGFSDVERMWSLQQLKKAMGDVPWEVVERKLGMSRARRQQLLRLDAFSPEQQRRIALLRMQETQLRSLHSALRNNRLATAQVDEVIDRLGEIAEERVKEQRETVSGPDNEKKFTGIAPLRQGIDGPTVARLGARAARQEEAVVTSVPTPRPVIQFRRGARIIRQAMAQIQQRAAKFDRVVIDEVLSDIGFIEAQLAEAKELFEQRLKVLETEEE